MNNNIGKQAETLAYQFLKKRGYRLQTTNYQCRVGEIDLIMKNSENELVFVEVRFRKNKQFGGPLESITQTKQNKIIKTAQYYLQQQNNPDIPCRFDVIAISLEDNQPNIEWIEDAFRV